MGTKHLEENQKILYRQTIKAPPNIDEEELRALYSQLPNRRFMFLPFYHLVAMYYAGKKTLRSRKSLCCAKAAAERKFDRKIARATSQRRDQQPAIPETSQD